MFPLSDSTTVAKDGPETPTVPHCPTCKMEAEEHPCLTPFLKMLSKAPRDDGKDNVWADFCFVELLQKEKSARSQWLRVVLRWQES